MVKIGDIIEMTIPGSGCYDWQVGEKAEIVGTGRKDIYYARFLNTNTLIELRNNGFEYFKKLEGSQIIK